MRKILYSLIVMVSAIAMTSCDDGPEYRYGYDPYLEGMWQLTYINGTPIGGYDTNWLEFYNNGSGTYYYYSNGYLQQMPLWFGVSNDLTWLYIDYDDGVSLDCNYWMNSNGTRLYMQWTDGYGQQLYVYDYVNSSTPWYAPKSGDDQQLQVDKSALGDSPFTFDLSKGLRPVRR